MKDFYMEYDPKYKCWELYCNGEEVLELNKYELIYLWSEVDKAYNESVKKDG